MQTTVFNKKNVGSLRAVFIDNEPYFSADDISKIFMTEKINKLKGIGNDFHAVKSICESIQQDIHRISGCTELAYKGKQ